MIRSVLLLAAAAALAGCGTRNTPTRGDRAATDKAPADDDGGQPAAPVKRVLLAWGLEPLPSGTRTKVYLTATDEMGRAVSHAIGEFDGTCTEVGAIELYQATLAVTCGGAGVQLHAVAGRGEVVVLAMDVAEGTEPDPMARRQIARIATPIDAAISAAP